MIKVNGISYGWADVDVKIPGLNLVLQEISYDDEQEKEESYGYGYRPRRDTPAYFAAMYLLTADPDTAKRTANCFCRDGIMFGYATTKGISPHGYTLLSAARDIYASGDGVALTDLADGEVIDIEAFCLIINALLIARYGSAALELQQRERQ